MQCCFSLHPQTKIELVSVSQDNSKYFIRNNLQDKYLNWHYYCNGLIVLNNMRAEFFFREFLRLAF
jgi:hypothetical protein